MKCLMIGAMISLAGAVATSSLQAAPMLTAFGEKVTSENCWREYPRPQMVRDNWTCLNGDWDYAITSVTNTPGRPEKWSGRIRVPFAVESALSGVGRLLEPDEFLWYTRTITCEPKEGRRILLHFDGVDYMAMVFIGHDEVTDIPHVGAYEPFTLDITDYVKAGENELTVCVWDPTGTNDGANTNARGKQDLHTHACFYTRCSGIWQSVWMEEVPERYIRGYKITTDIDSSTARFEFDIAGGGDVAVKVEGLSSEQPTIRASDHVVVVKIPDAELWSPENPKLYEFTAKCGEDEIRGYFAMRKIEKRRDAKGILRYFLNNKPVFLYGPLDQGWWPDGLLTPPSDEAMAFDIQAVKDFGFNMMRKHIKVEPRRYYYHCDRLGLMVLQDLPCFNGSSDSPLRPEMVFGYAEQRRDLKSMIDNLGNCPCIVEWIPYNEGWSQPGQFLTHSALDFVRRYDPTRLVGGPSGYWDWEGGAETPRNGYVSWDGGEHTNACWSCAHKPTGVCEMGDTVDMHYYRGPGMPEVNDRRISFLGEFGGLGHPVRGHLWTEFDQSAHYRRENPDKADSWGYGGMSDTGTREGLQRTYLKLAEQVGELATKGLGGAVYTQTTDVEIEINGLMTYDRKVLKFDPAALRQAHRAVLDKVASGSATKVFAATDGRIAPLHQAGQPPNPMGEIAWGEKMFHYLPEAGIRYSRLHDTGGAYGGGKFVDIANLFRDFDADENDPKSYDFVFTDLLLEKMVTNGIAPFFRLGETIENHAHIRRYRTFVPRDMEKWARICEHVIAHYTEGWANGFNYKIDYWEIWNEPDFTSESWNPMWSGNVDDFLMLYETTATHLKRRFPNIKIGGYGSCGFWAITSEERAKRDGKDARTAERKAQEEYHVAFLRKLLDRVQAKGVPLDFLTFHSYSSVPDMIRQVEWICEEMERRGLGAVELNLDEWLPEPDGKKLGTAKQAAEIAAVLAGASHTRLGMAMIYDARCGVGAYSPLFNCLTFKPHPAYSVMKFYDTLYRAGCRAPVAEDRVNGFYAAAATDGQGKGWLLLSNIGENPHALPELAEGWKAVGCRTIDSKRVDVRIDVPPSIAPGQVLLVEAVRGVLSTASADRLADGFAAPPADAKPQVWWHWNNGNISKEGITADLEAMASAGIGGAHIFDVDSGTPLGPVRFNTPEWDEMALHAHREAQRLGLKLTLANCSGYSSSGGPWVTAEDSMKCVTWTETAVSGGRRLSLALPQPADCHGWYRDIAVFAVRKPAAERHLIDEPGAKVERTSPAKNACRYEIVLPRKARASAFTYTTDSPVLWFHTVEAVVECRGEDGAYREVGRAKDLVCYGGSVNRLPRFVGFPAAESDGWRLTFTFTDSVPGRCKIAAVDIGEFQRFRDLGKKVLDAPSGRDSFSPLADTVDPRFAIGAKDVIPLNDLFGDGKLEWDAPEGEWTILRIGAVANGTVCSPATPGGVGFEVDKFDRKALRRHFDAFVGRIAKACGIDPKSDPAKRSGIVASLVDSYEVGGQNWTARFPEEFRRRRGYDVVCAYLPALTGRIIGSVAETDRFLADFRETCAELFREEYAQAFTEYCHASGLQSAVESYGEAPAPNFTFADECDLPMTEFWLRGLNSVRVPNAVTGVVAQARRNGRRVIQSESFTSAPDNDDWKQPLWAYKAQGDRIYVAGVNRIVYHRFAHQPWVDVHKRPGMTMGFWGTHFERTQTYWPYVGDWIRYQSRCQFLLQEGEFVCANAFAEPAWTCRRYEDGSMGWFVASTSDVPHRVCIDLGSVPVALKRSVPEIWDPETGLRLQSASFERKGDHLCVNLDFEWRDSVFVMLRPKNGEADSRPLQTGRKVVATVPVTGPWEVSFDKEMGGPGQVEFPSLVSWPDRSEPGIRYYSGTAVYRKTVSAPERKADERLELDLGEVKELAQAKVNGKALPVLWKKPYRVDITEAADGAKELKLEIDVVNLWPNRMIGDAALPKEKRYTFSVYEPWKASDPLLPSGLLGPVRFVVTGKRLKTSLKGDSQGVGDD